MKPTYISLYCVKCKIKTETRDLLNVKSKNDRAMLRGICTECGTTKTQFVKHAKGGDLVGSLNSVTKNIKLPWARFFPGKCICRDILSRVRLPDSI